MRAVRAKKVFTEEVLASLPGLVAKGLQPREIAAMIGSTPGSVKVRCSQLKISLRAPNKRCEPEPPFNAAAPFATRLANIQLKVKIDADTLGLISMQAEKKGTTVGAIAEKLLQVVARDNLYEAVIDEGKYQK